MERLIILLPSVCALAFDPPAPTVVVAGSTGRVGSAVVRSLVERGGVNVVALARDAQKAQSIFDAFQGVTVAEADYADAAALDAALCELPAYRLFIACANVPQQAELETNLCEAAARHGAAYAVKLSTVTPVLEMEQGGPYAAHLAAEAALAGCGVPFTILRPNLFMQMLTDGFLGLGLGVDGDGEHPFAASRISMIDARDVGAVAAALLAQPSPAASIHNGATYRLTGPAAVAVGDELAAAVSALRPQAVTVSPCEVAAHVRRRMAGLPAAAAASVEGFLGVLAGSCDEVTAEVERLSGRPATSVEAFVREHAPAFLPLTFRRLLGTPAGSFAAGAEVARLPMAAELAALGEDELLLKVLVAGVNGGADTFRLTRAAPDAAELPLGSEGVGVVVACGAAARARHAPGERVLFLGGGYSEYVRLPAASCFAPPPGESEAAELVALRISGLTAATALGRTARVGEGDVVVVTACCGATGSFAVQEAAARGATVVGTVGSDEKAAAAAALGVARVVNYKRERLGAVLQAEYPQGVAVAYEGVGGVLLRDVHDNLAEGGVVLLVGSISQYPHNAAPEPHGIEGVADAMEIFRAGETVELGGGRRIVGNVWGDAFGSVEPDGERTLTTIRKAMYERHARGALTALVDDARPGAPRFEGVERAPDAVAHMLAGRNVGKVVVRVAWDA